MNHVPSITINNTELDEQDAGAVVIAVEYLKAYLAKNDAPTDFAAFMSGKLQGSFERVSRAMEEVMPLPQEGEGGLVELSHCHHALSTRMVHDFVFHDMMRYWYAVADLLCTKGPGLMARLEDGRLFAVADAGGELMMFELSDYNRDTPTAFMTLLGPTDYDFSDGCEYADMREAFENWLKNPVFERICPRTLADHVQSNLCQSSNPNWKLRGIEYAVDHVPVKF